MSVPSSCDRYQDDLAELALGTLTGRDRAEALAHVESCGRCAGEVEELSRAADVLLQVAPEAEPPVGFEVRLLEQVAAKQATRQREGSREEAVLPFRPPAGTAGWRRRVRRLAGTVRGRTVAAAAIVLGGVGIGLAATAGGGPATSHPTAVQAALLGTGGQPVGRVVASSGSPAWLFMMVDSGTLPTHVTCRVGLAGGRWMSLGTFSLSRGYGTWSAPLAVPASTVREAELVGAHGVVLATATFPTPA
jgi:hypothetical protein